MKALRVLVADSGFMLGTLIAEMLEEMGHHVCAIEATEAAAVALEKPFREAELMRAIQRALNIEATPSLTERT